MSWREWVRLLKRQVCLFLILPLHRGTSSIHWKFSLPDLTTKYSMRWECSSILDEWRVHCLVNAAWGIFLNHRTAKTQRQRLPLTGNTVNIFFFFKDQRRTNADNILRNSQEVSTNVNGQREGRRPTGNQSEICAKTKSQLLYLLFCDLRVQARP